MRRYPHAPLRACPLFPVLALLAALLPLSACATRHPAGAALPDPAATAGPPDVLLLTHIRGWGSATPLPDGSYVTAMHVLEHAPRRLGERDASRFVLTDAGLWPHPAPDDFPGAHRPVFAIDWARFVILPRAVGSAARRTVAFDPTNAPPTPPTALPARPLQPGDTVLVAGYINARQLATTAAEATADADPAPRSRPLLHRFTGRVRPHPFWIPHHERTLIFFETPRGLSCKGMSGGPVSRLNPDTGEHELVGIYVGQFDADFFWFRTTVGVAVPWPPPDFTGAARPD